MSRCIYCWEKLSVESDEPAWHDACEREMNKQLLDVVVLKKPATMEASIARSLKGQPPLYPPKVR